MTCAKGICLELLERWKNLPQYSGLSRDIAQLALHQMFCAGKLAQHLAEEQLLREAEASVKLAQEDK